ncbi:MAG TPA: hemolysin III family protein [Pirellulales bacterium]|nr:hemolysin III family protein [Pirellulales bacterium]
MAISSDNTFDAGTATLPRLEDEIANSITHGIGLALSLVGAAALVIAAARTADTREFVGCLIYGLSLVAVYAASTLSHVFWQPRLRRVFRMLDQGCIYLLIAGTFTPLALRYLRDGWWWVLLATMWTIAVVGFCSKVFLAHRVEAVSTAAYVVMGWLPVLAAKPMIAVTPGRCLWMMFAGGLCYTVGTLFLTFDRKALYLHAVWHIFVIAGSAVHYFAILEYALPGATV